MAKRKPLVIPDGMTAEELSAAAEEYLRKKRREYNKTHPDIIQAQRDRAAANRLKRRGFVILELGMFPPGDPWKWDELTIRGIADALRAQVAEAREAVSA